MAGLPHRAARLTGALVLVAVIICAAVIGVGLIGATVSSATAAAPQGSWWHPPARPTWFWQLQGRLDLSVNADVYDVDGFGTSAATVAALHRAGRHVICYIDVGTWERWRPDAGDFPASVLGRSDGWPGERWLDLRRLGVLEPIMTRRLAMCATKGFDAVEPDNLDPLGNRPGFPLTRAQVIRYARWIAAAAHRLGLAVLQKNGPELVSALEPDFDGALVEQCNQYRECGAFRPYVSAGKPVLNAEYAARLYPGFCAADRREGLQGVLFDLALDGRHFSPCPTGAPG
jgi:hypothetical protein